MNPEQDPAMPLVPTPPSGRDAAASASAATPESSLTIARSDLKPGVRFDFPNGPLTFVGIKLGTTTIALVTDADGNQTEMPIRRFLKIANYFAQTGDSPLEDLRLASTIAAETHSRQPPEKTNECSRAMQATWAETTGQWFLTEMCFFCRRPAGRKALQDSNTLALICQRCRRLNSISVTAGRLAQAAAWASGPILLWTAITYALLPFLGFLDRRSMSGWWLIPVCLSCLLLVFCLLRMILLLEALAKRVAWRQPFYCGFEDGQHHWVGEYHTSSVPPQIQYQTPIQLPNNRLDYSPGHERGTG